MEGVLDGVPDVDEDCGETTDVDLVGVTVGVGEIVTEDVFDKLETMEGVLDGVPDVDGDFEGTTDVELVGVAVVVGEMTCAWPIDTNINTKPNKIEIRIADTAININNYNP